MARWTPDEDALLRACVEDGLTAEESSRIIDRPKGGVAARAARLDLAFDSSSNRGLRDFIAASGRLIREEIGGAVGIRWASAHRSAGTFSTSACERLLSAGILKRDAPTNTFYAPASL